jgi:radical SAM modification target selenobiotic family peptide
LTLLHETVTIQSHEEVSVTSTSSLFSYPLFKEDPLMISKDMKKFLAGLGVAGLISAGGISVPGAHATGSG